MTPPTLYRGSLEPETAAAVIERALARFLALATQRRLKEPEGQVWTETPAALRGFRRKALYDNQLRFVKSVGRVFRFDAYETAPDDNVSIFAPSDAGAAAGRWLREGATSAQRTSRHQGIRDAALRLEHWALQSTGFADLVRIYEGQYDDTAIAELFARKPCYVVAPGGSSRDPRSLVPGTYYLKKFRYRIWGVSQNLRRGPAGLLGSAVGIDGGDPGLEYVMGKIERTLAGSTLGIAGVASTEIGEEEIVAHDLANRVFCNALEVTVSATLHLPDDDLRVLSAVRTTTQLAAAADGERAIDLSNYVADGCHPDRSGPRLTTIRGGIAYISGALVQAVPQTLTLPALSDSYRDLLPTGAFVVQSVAAGDPAPPLPAKALRVGVTKTDASAVISDQFLCSTLFDLIGPDDIPRQS